MTFVKVSKISKPDKYIKKQYIGVSKIFYRALKRAIEHSGILSANIHLEHPANDKHGDYSTNVAMVTFESILQSRRNSSSNWTANIPKSPRELALKIVDRLKEDRELTGVVGKIEVAGPGFINFWLNKEHLTGVLKEIVEKSDAYGSLTVLDGKKIMVEYTDPNPFKEFHIGHLYSNLIGESLANLFEALGAKVWRADFYGDVGMHVAKSVWGMMKKMKADGITLSQLEKKSVKERQKFLGKGYGLGVKKYESDEQAKEEIKELNYFIYVASQEVLIRDKGWKPIVDYTKYIKNKIDRLKLIKPVYERGLKWSLAYFEQIYKRLGTEFDGYYPESWTGEVGMKLVEEGLKRGILEKSNGAVVYRGEQDGLHTRVFVNKLGLPTYEAKDLGLAKAKYQDFQYDLSINVFGKEIDDYYKVVLSALKKIKPELGRKSTYIAHGMVNLPEGKMSSRTGNVITVEWLLKQTKRQALKAMIDSGFSENEKEEILEMVTQSAVKYAFLKHNIGGNILFDFGRSVSLEGDSGPYIQYTYARCMSVFRKSSFAVSSIAALPCQPLQDFKELELEELSVLRWIYRFTEVVCDAAFQYSPNLVCSFLFELAQRYNTFYHKHSVLQAKTNKQKQFRLLLTVATAQIIKNGLYFLGIKAPERM